MTSNMESSLNMDLGSTFVDELYNDIEAVTNEFEFDEDLTRWINSIHQEELQSEKDPQSGSRTCEICHSRDDAVCRSCCNTPICHECMETYINTKVSEGNYLINCPSCNYVLHHDLIKEYLQPELQHKFIQFLTDGNADPCTKTCPCCGTVYSLEPKKLKKSKRKLRNGLKICCPQCKFVWCFLCHAPYHSGLTCKEHRKGDAMVHMWAKEWSYGQFNAHKCPNCKIYIQKNHGCDHVRCTRCLTDFCYRCGERYRGTRYFGNHVSRFSIFGCKYRLLPERPALRRLIRGASFVALIGKGILLGCLGIAVGALVIGTSVIILPYYGIVNLRRHILRKRSLKMFENRKAEIIAREAALRRTLGGPEGEEMQVPADSGADVGIVEGMDTQQVHVIVHRSMSMDQDDAASKYSGKGASGSSSLMEEREEKGGFFVNKFTAEGSEVVVMKSLSGEGPSEGSGPDSVITVTDFKEVPSTGGYMKLVANIVSRPAVGKPVPPSAAPEAPAQNEMANGDGDFTPNEFNESDVSERGGRQFQETQETTKIPSEKGDVNEKSRVDSVKVEKFYGRHRRRSASFPRNARELVQACARTDCLGYGRKAASPQSTEQRPDDGSGHTHVNLRNDGEADSTTVSPDLSNSEEDTAKDCGGYNGCFGNIFSKLGQSQQSSGPPDGNGSGVGSKPQQFTPVVGSRKNTGFGSKSSTWEKTRRDCVQALLLSRALSPTGGGGGNEDADCMDLHETGAIRMSSTASRTETDKASFNRVLAGMSLLDSSVVMDDSLLLEMSELDLSHVQQSLLEDFIAGGSKKCPRKLLQAGTESVKDTKMKLKKEKLCQDLYQTCKKPDLVDVCDNCCESRDALRSRSDEGDAGTACLASTTKRRRSMEEIGTRCLYKEASLMLGTSGSCNDISLHRDLPSVVHSPHLNFECHISPSTVITRL